MTLEETIRILRSPEGRDETRRVYLLRRAVDWAEITIRGGDVSRVDAEEIGDAVATRAEELFPGSRLQLQHVSDSRLRRGSVLRDGFHAMPWCGPGRRPATVRRSADRPHELRDLRHQLQ